MPPADSAADPDDEPDLTTMSRIVPMRSETRRGSDGRTEGTQRHASRRAASHHFWKSLVAALAAGYQAGFLWVAAVGVYLLCGATSTACS